MGQVDYKFFPFIKPPRDFLTPHSYRLCLKIRLQRLLAVVLNLQRSANALLTTPEVVQIWDTAYLSDGPLSSLSCTPLHVTPFTLGSSSSRSARVGFCLVCASATLSLTPCPRSKPSNFCIAVSALRIVSKPTNLQQIIIATLVRIQEATPSKISSKMQQSCFNMQTKQQSFRTLLLKHPAMPCT